MSLRLSSVVGIWIATLAGADYTIFTDGPTQNTPRSGCSPAHGGLTKGGVVSRGPTISSAEIDELIRAFTDLADLTNIEGRLPWGLFC